MQKEIGGSVAILGVNGPGAEAGNAAMCDGRDLPWLQDTPAEHVWTQWQVVYRDVIILDAENKEIAVFNLTDHDLSDPAEYAALRALLVR